MIFGWGKKKIANENVGANVLEKQITFSEISEVLRENETVRLKKIVASAKSIKDLVETERKNIIQIISHLEEDRLKVDDADKHIKMLVERGKEAVITGLRKETTINLSNIQKYSDIVSLNSEVGQMLKRVGDILGVNTKVMHIFARKYADKLKGHIAQIANKKAELQKLVDEHTEFESMTTSLSESCEKIKNYQKEIGVKKNELSKVSDEIKNNERVISDLELKIQSLESKNEYKEFLKIKKEIEMLVADKDRINHEIDLQFSKISRPLGKYSYISSLEKPLKKIMGELIVNPSNVFTQENKNSIIEVLHAVVKGVVAGSVSVKDTDKAVQQIEETINRLDEFLKMRSDISQKRIDLENRQGVFNIKDLEETERNLIKSRSKKIECESTIRNLGNEIAEDAKIIPQLVHDVEIKLKEVSGTKMTLKI